MSNALAQNATNLSVAGQGEENFDILACVKRNAERTAKGATRERKFLQYNKLLTACLADYRSHFPAIYGKTERLPSTIFEQVDKTVTEYIQEQLNRVTVANVIGIRRGFYHNQREMEIIDRIHSIGENKLSLAEQMLGVNIFINNANKKLDDLMKKPTPDYDREKEMRAQIMRLQITKDFILGEMKHQEELAKTKTEEVKQ